MKRRYPSHLRIHLEDSTSNAPSSDLSRSNNQSGLPRDEIQDVLRSFTDATSWTVSERPQKNEPINGMVGHHLPNQNGVSKRWRLLETIVQDGSLDAEDSTVSSCVPMDRAQHLLASIERLVARLDVAEETVRRQEAELATVVGITSYSDRGRETADRLESILESVARSLGAVAGALYLLDDETSSLKMRSCIGLPKTRLTAPPRELRGVQEG